MWILYKRSEHLMMVFENQEEALEEYKECKEELNREFDKVDGIMSDGDLFLAKVEKHFHLVKSQSNMWDFKEDNLLL